MSALAQQMLNEKGAAKLTRPEMKWEYNPDMALQEAYRMIITGDKTIRPLEVIAEVNPQWEDDVLRMHEFIRYYRDYYSLPLETREMIEQPIQEG